MFEILVGLNALAGILFFELAMGVALARFLAGVLMPLRAFCFLNAIGVNKAAIGVFGLNALAGILFFELVF